jgi:hypothetical protein
MAADTRTPAQRPRRSRVRRAWWRHGVAAALAFGVGALAPVAQAANLFTLDPHGDSFAPVVVDSAGNGYVAWLHAGSPASVMFCKLPRGAKSCAAPITLPVPGGGVTDEASQPFPILASDFIYVVAPRYVDDDTLIYRSADGGKTFSLYGVPPGSYSGKTGPDDIIPTNTKATPYSGGPTSLPGELYFEIGASNPGLGYSFSTWGMTFPPAGGSTALSFSNVGAGLVGGSTLGVTGAGDAVEAYWLESTSPVIAYYRWSATSGLPSAPEQFGWGGPTIVTTNGYLPRESAGPAGLFMLSADGTSSAANPSRLDVRKYDQASHAFGTPTTLATLTPGETGYADGGGLDQNSTTGELAAVWPVFGDPVTIMRLYVSTNGGASFSAGQEVAAVGHGYADSDNARVALASDGSGFLTFRDNGGIEVADLYPLATQFKILSSIDGAVDLPFTCTAPHGTCRVVISITVGARTAAEDRRRASTAILARGKFTIAAGRSRTLRVRLTPAGRKAFGQRRGPLHATLTLRLTGGRARDVITTPVTIR